GCRVSLGEAAGAVEPACALLRAGERGGVAVIVSVDADVMAPPDQFADQALIEAPGTWNDVVRRARAGGFFERQEPRDEVRQAFRRIDVVREDDGRPVRRAVRSTRRLAQIVEGIG